MVIYSRKLDMRLKIEIKWMVALADAVFIDPTQINGFQRKARYSAFIPRGEKDPSFYF